MSQALLARAYGWLYDAMVDDFGPYEKLVASIAARIAAEPRRDGRPRRVLDVACGTGTLVRRLAVGGDVVVGLDGVAHLTSIARQATEDFCRVWIHQGDLGESPAPGAGTFDVLVSMHTLSWHPAPPRLLAGCLEALRPGGLAIFVAHARPPEVMDTARRLRAREGVGSAVRSLRWTVPTALFNRVRQAPRRYLDCVELDRRLTGRGFAVESIEPVFLGGVSHMALARRPLAATADECTDVWRTSTATMGDQSGAAPVKEK